MIKLKSINTIGILLFIFLISTGVRLSAQQECGFTDTTGYKKIFDQYREFKNSHINGLKNTDEVIVVPVSFFILVKNCKPVYFNYSFEELIEYANIYFAPAHIQFEYCNTYYYEEKYSYLIDNQSLKIFLRDNLYTCGTGSISGGGVTLNVECNTINKTFVHELGHNFGLLHTHPYILEIGTDELVDGSNCETAGDFICDTPADPNLSSRVTENCLYFGLGSDSNGEAYQPDTHNHMSYSRKTCRNHFSPEQKALMYSRAEILNYKCESEPTSNYYTSLFDCLGIDFGVYPNPATSVVKIVFSDKSFIGYDIYLYNSLGQVVYKNIKFQENILSIPLTGMPSGIYTIKASNKKNIFIDKLFIK